jgi:hypothetical protein
VLASEMPKGAMICHCRRTLAPYGAYRAPLPACHKCEGKGWYVRPAKP